MSFEKFDENAPTAQIADGYSTNSNESLCSNFRGEFRLGMIKITADTPKGRIDWVKAWGYSFILTNPIAYLCLRSCSAIIALCLILQTMIVNMDNGTWFAFLTHWVQIINTTFLCLAVACTIWLQLKTRRGEASDGLSREMPFVIRFMWAFQNIGLVASLIVTILYWTLLARGSEGFLNFFPHGGLFILVTIDFILSASPFHYLHTLYPFIFASSYTIFNGILWATGALIRYKPWVYEVVCWCTDKTRSPFSQQNPYNGTATPTKTAIITIALPVVAVPVLNLLLFFAFAKLRRVARYPAQTKPADLA